MHGQAAPGKAATGRGYIYFSYACGRHKKNDIALQDVVLSYILISNYIASNAFTSEVHRKGSVTQNQGVANIKNPMKAASDTSTPSHQIPVFFFTD